MLDLCLYTDRFGRSLFERWYAKLEEDTRARIAVSIDRLRQGNIVAKGVGSGVLEMRLDFGPGYRVYFGRDGDRLVILLTGGTKRRQQSDIDTAQLLWKEYKQRKGDADATYKKF